MTKIKVKKLKYYDKTFYNISTPSSDLIFKFKEYLISMDYIAFIVNNVLYFEEDGINGLSFNYVDDYIFMLPEDV